MAATVGNYSLAPNWTATDLFDALEEAFVDAGLVTTAAFDRYSSGAYSHMVVEVVYDAVKTYGKRYYRFLFFDNELWLNVSNGWDPVAHVPTGTQYLDFLGSTSTSTTGYWEFLGLDPTISLDVRRYQSGIDADFAVFRLANGTNGGCFWLVPASATLQPWLDLSRNSFGVPHYPYCYVPSFSYWTLLSFPTHLGLRRDAHTGTALRSSTNWSGFNCAHYTYLFTGNSTSSSENFRTGGNVQPFAASNGYDPTFNSYIPLPVDDPANNPAQPATKFPIFAGLPYNAYVQDPLPADFGVVGQLSSGLSPGDRLQVIPGTEEWEIVTRKNSASYTANVPTPCFVCRVV